MTACIRPSDNYDTKVHSSGTALDAVEKAPTPMGGSIEWARFQLLGTNLGFGTTLLFGDLPRADGAAFTVGYAYFGYPKDEAFDRTSSFVSPGPSGKDRCATRVRAVGYVGITEYVDVGDHIALTAPDGDRIVLERDPPAHPVPAGESFFAGYGGVTAPVVQGHELLHDTWRPASEWQVSWPGTVVPPTATMGSVPFPLEGGASLRMPAEITGLKVNGERVRAPVHVPRYNFEPENACIDEERYRDDDVRFAGPWEQDMTVSWEAGSGEPVTVMVRYLGAAVEGYCPYGTDGECGAGFHCTKARECWPDEGSNSIVLAEVACTVADDGEFTLTANDLAGIGPEITDRAAGTVLVVARIADSTAKVPDVLTHNGKRVNISPVRLRGIDAVFTRLGWPTVAASERAR